MTTNQPAHREHGTAPLTRWVHTGIEAPYQLMPLGYAEVEMPTGWAYSAKMAHPEHGVVGLIYNTGVGELTTFHSYENKFRDSDLEAFAAQCRHDGEPLSPGDVGLADLLDEVINEARLVDDVARMRRDGQFLVRTYEPRTDDNNGPLRGDPEVCRDIILTRSDRKKLVARLATRLPRHTLTYWQMFNGREWVRLTARSALTAQQQTARIDDLVARHKATTTDPTEIMEVQQLPDGLYAVGARATGFTLVGDRRHHVDRLEWCQCPPHMVKAVRFELWTVQEGRIEAGTVHAAKECRRLVTVD